MSKGRKLSLDEKVLWDKISKTISDSKFILSNIDEEEETKNKKIKPIKSIQKIVTDLKDQSRIKPRFGETLGTMDQNTLRKLKRGKLTPEAKLDLHGLTTDQAYKALYSFINNNYKLKKRLVLIITGKGERNYNSEDSFSNKGVLRKTVPQWLKSPAISGFILDFVQSHIKDGGSGALYVYLKKNKNFKNIDG